MSIPLHPAIHPDSFLAKVSQLLPLLTSRGQSLPRFVPLHLPEQDTSALIVAIDNGNDAFKGAVLHAHLPALVDRRILTAYAPAKTIRMGEGITTYQVNASEWFWIGEEAVSTQKSESLPVGLTTERLSDERFQSYLAACLVELLLAACYEPGSYTLYASFGIPNEEMTLRGAKPDVAAALRRFLNTPFDVHRTDEHGKTAHWHLRLLDLTPYPQSFGSFAAWYYTIDGRPIETTVVRHVTLDIGGGQFHDCEVDLTQQTDGRVKLRMAANLLGDGTIAIARAAREAIRARYPSIHLSDAEAQQVLLTKKVIVGGHRVAVDEVVTDVIAARSQNLFTKLLPLIQEGRNFLQFTGGGSTLLEQELRALVQPARAYHEYLFVPPEVAPVLNVIGGYVLAQAAAGRILASGGVAARTPLTTPGVR
jgi:hypothetical protein